MKFLISILVAMSATAFGASSTPHSQPNELRHEAVSNLDWAQVEEYIVAHAVQVDQQALTQLRVEAMLGVKTWVLTHEIDSLQDGPGLGWPRIGSVIEFGSSSEAKQAANLVMAVTVGYSK